MKKHLFLLWLAGALFSAAQAAGIVLVTNAYADGVSCCDGYPTRTFSYHLASYSQVEPARNGALVGYVFSRALSCAAGPQIEIKNVVYPIVILGNSHEGRSSSYELCPFGLRAFAELVAFPWFVFPTATSFSSSACSQPCLGLLCDQTGSGAEPNQRALVDTPTRQPEPPEPRTSTR